MTQSDKPDSGPDNDIDAGAPEAPDTADTQPGERIAKVLSRAGLASRRDAEIMVAEGRVTVNGKRIDSPATNVLPSDRVAVDGTPLPPPEPPRVWLFHKPPGVVTTARDELGRRTIHDILPPEMPRVMPVGRLDLTSEGLLLLTNDGEIKRRLELPSTGWLRRYRVRVHGAPDEDRLDPLRRGIVVEGESFAPMTVTLDRRQGANAWLTVGLREGRNREVRRAMEAVGLVVNRLIRISYGPFQLADLIPGGIEEVRPRVLRDQLGLAETPATADPVAKPARSRKAAAAPRAASTRISSTGSGGAASPTKSAAARPAGSRPSVARPVSPVAGERQDLGRGRSVTVVRKPRAPLPDAAEAEGQPLRPARPARRSGTAGGAKAGGGSKSGGAKGPAARSRSAMPRAAGGAFRPARPPRPGPAGPEAETGAETGAERPRAFRGPAAATRAVRSNPSRPGAAPASGGRPKPAAGDRSRKGPPATARWGRDERNGGQAEGDRPARAWQPRSTSGDTGPSRAAGSASGRKGPESPHGRSRDTRADGGRSFGAKPPRGARHDDTGSAGPGGGPSRGTPRPAGGGSGGSPKPRSRAPGEDPGRPPHSRTGPDQGTRRAEGAGAKRAEDPRGGRAEGTGGPRGYGRPPRAPRGEAEGPARDARGGPRAPRTAGERRDRDSGTEGPRGPSRGFGKPAVGTGGPRATGRDSGKSWGGGSGGGARTSGPGGSGKSGLGKGAGNPRGDRSGSGQRRPDGSGPSGPRPSGSRPSGPRRPKG